MNKHEDLMNEKPLVIVKKGDKLVKGQLIGYLNGKGKIGACYPVYSMVNSTEVNFVLFEKNGYSVLDNTWIRENAGNHTMYTNEEPIIVDVKPAGSTFQNEVINIFS